MSTTNASSSLSRLDQPLPARPNHSDSVLSTVSTSGSYDRLFTVSTCNDMHTTMNALDQFLSEQPNYVNQMITNNPLYKNIEQSASSSSPSSSSSSVPDPISYILETYDLLIAPQILNSPTADAAPSSIAPLRRFLYRKHFLDEAIKLLASSYPITSVEQLIPIIQASCVKCGLTLM